VGLHEIVILYAQGTGGSGLQVDFAATGNANVRMPNSILIADPADFKDGLVFGIPQTDIAGTAFSLEVGTFGVVNGPGTGLLDLTGDTQLLNGSLLFSNLFIESPGAVIATKGSTTVKDGILHVELPIAPPPGKLTPIGDFSGAPLGLALFNKATATLDCPKGNLVYKSALKSLYVSTSDGTVLILR
jgi:hypothetical protein